MKKHCLLIIYHCKTHLNIFTHSNVVCSLVESVDHFGSVLASNCGIHGLRGWGSDGTREVGTITQRVTLDMYDVSMRHRGGAVTAPAFGAPVPRVLNFWIRVLVGLSSEPLDIGGGGRGLVGEANDESLQRIGKSVHWDVLRDVRFEL